MKTLSHTTSNITTETYQLALGGKLLTFTEYFNDKGKVIDSTLQDVDGEEITDTALIEEVQKFIDNGQYVAEQQRRDEKNGLYPDKVDVAN